MTTDLIKRGTAEAMVLAYQEAEREIRQAYGILETAQARLKAAFEDRYGFDTTRDINGRVGTEAADQIMAGIKRAAWGALAERFELRRVLSSKRAAELDKQLETGEGLPAVETETILGMVESMVANLDTYLREAVAEVFAFLRPPRSELKTNTEYEIGKRAIVRIGYYASWDSKPHIRSGHSAQACRNLDNVFAMLDGKGPIKSYGGPLVDAIEGKAFGTICETDYFRFKVCRNGNMHLEFRRPDLVAKLNQIAAGHTLKHDNAAARQPASAA